MTDPIDPALWDDLDMRVALARHDLAEVYRRLKQAGFTQKAIAELTGQRESEIWEILSRDRPVQSYEVLVRISDGLGIPRGWMGLSYDESSAQHAALLGLLPASARPTYDQVEESVKRRMLLAAATMALVDRPVLGAVVALDHAPVATPLPAMVGRADVAALHRLTAEFRVLGRAGYGVPEVLSNVAQRADRLLLPLAATDTTRQELQSELADLHTLAGWWHTDMLQPDPARYHYSRAMWLAAQAGDVLEVVSSVRHAAVMDAEAGAPDTALKLYQMAQIKMDDAPAAQRARLRTQRVLMHLQSADAYAQLDRPSGVTMELARAAEHGTPDDPFDRADADYVRARTELTLGRFEAARQYAINSMRAWGSGDRRDSAPARITLATTHVIVGDSDAPKLVVAALDAVSELRSARGRFMLAPLGKALEAHRDSTSVDLAQRVEVLRQGSTTIV